MAFINFRKIFKSGKLFGKKKYVTNVSAGNAFFKSYANKCNGLIIFLDGRDDVKEELVKLQDEFEYAVASPDHRAAKIESKIEADFKALAELLEQPDFESQQAITLIKTIRRSVVEITSLVS